MNMSSVKFSAKILLFGEYALLAGGEGLAIPYAQYGTTWQQSQVTVRMATHIERSQTVLLDLCGYLAAQQANGNAPFEFDTDALEFDIQRGGYCDSDIPQGYGLGSSGAVTALLYDRYMRNKVPRSLANTALVLPELRRHLAFIEAYFHGNSSGIDPLVSYLGCPLLVSAHQTVALPLSEQWLPIAGIATQSAVDKVVLPMLGYEGVGEVVFLYDTGMPRHTAHLVQAFKARLQADEVFEQLCYHHLTALNRQCIASYCAGRTADLYADWQQLSVFQYRHFADLIPTHELKRLWLSGIESGHFFFKLCGAGGGGFMLGIARL